VQSSLTFDGEPAEKNLHWLLSNASLVLGIPPKTCFLERENNGKGGKWNCTWSWLGFWTWTWHFISHNTHELMRKLIRLHVTCLLNCFIADNGQWRKDSQYVVIIARNAILPRILSFSTPPKPNTFLRNRAQIFYKSKAYQMWL